MTETPSRVHHPVLARVHARMGRAAEARGQTECRRRLLEGLDGWCAMGGDCWSAAATERRRLPSSA